MSEPAEKLPAVAVLRAGIEDRGWTATGSGPGGSLYAPPGGGAEITVPHGDDDQRALHCLTERQVPGCLA